MAKQTINVGTAPNDASGDPLRNAFIKTNENFTEVYGDIQNLQADSVTETEMNDAIAAAVVLASQAEAQGNTENTKIMTALRVFQNWSNNVANYAVTAFNTTAKTIVGAVNELVTSITAKTDKLILTNRQTASYTLALSDQDKIVEMNVASANNLTVPQNSSVAFPIGSQIIIAQYGAGQTTIVADTNVTIRSEESKLNMNAQYSMATLIKIATNEWYLTGGLA